jgi:hypothetical protein
MEIDFSKRDENEAQLILKKERRITLIWLCAFMIVVSGSFWTLSVQ